MAKNIQKMVEELIASPTHKKKAQPQIFVDEASQGTTLIKAEPEVKPEEGTVLHKAWSSLLDSRGKVERLAFEVSPTETYNRYHTLYKPKYRLIPDPIIKRLLIQDDLVATIVQARQNHVASFARPRPDRFSTGFVLDPRQSTVERHKKLAPEAQKEAEEKLRIRVEEVTKIIMSCGDPSLDISGNQEKLTFSQYMAMSTRNAIGVGRIATEILYEHPTPETKKFKGFRVIDAGTIYKCAPQRSAAEQVRLTGLKMLADLRNERLDPERYSNDEYAWVQVIDDRPVMAFTAEECIVHNFYPVPDVEMDGYPVTPLDNVISAVTTHLNIGTHNKLYFENGRASRGMLVIKSDDADATVLMNLRQQFNAQINSVSNSFRVPLFSIGAEDEVIWTPMDSAGRDMEFQYLSDMNARVIMGAFLISPDELPGWSYLSRGTNSQSLCLHPDSVVYTTEGGVSIKSILNGEENRDFKVWTGTDWAEARAFVTGKKKQVRTRLGNGSELITSPDHRFQVITNDGPIWKRQVDLTEEDFVLVNKQEIPVIGKIPEYFGRPLTTDIMEVLGWMTGDGCLSLRFNKNTGNLKQGSIVWFYHHEKEVDIWKKHAKILTDFGLNVKNTNHVVSEREVEWMKRVKGVATVAPNRLRNTLYCNDFVKWLLSLGFTPSSEGKTIPPFIYTLSPEMRSAFLRGMFSSDGTRDKKSGAIRIVIHDNRLREQTKLLLLSLGIRTQEHEGLFKNDFGFGDRPRIKTPARTFLAVKDKTLFFEKVGFLQGHKQPLAGQLDRVPRWEMLPKSLGAYLVKIILETDKNVHKLSSMDRNNLCTVINPKAERGISLATVKKHMLEVGLSIPAWLDNHWLEPVISKEDLSEEIEMVDVEVFDDRHAFIANGISVHNSEGNREYIIEASRDVGIRPLLAQFENFINHHLLPLIDEELAKDVVFKLVGLEAETAEKESARLQQDSQIHMTYDEVLKKVEKKPIGSSWGGEFPLSPQYQAILDKYMTVGMILEKFFDIKGASKDPRFDYLRDPFYFQQMALLQQNQQLQQANQAQQAQAQQGQLPPGQGEAEGTAPPDQSGQAPASPSPQDQQAQSELDDAVNQALSSLNKGEAQLSPDRKAILAKQKLLVKEVMDNWEGDTEESIQEILNSIKHLAPKK